MTAVQDLSPRVGTVRASAALGVPRASYYRWRNPRATARNRPIPSRALTTPQRSHVLEVLNSERFADLAPREVFATLLDEGTYLCSPRSMYRILAANNQVKERRNQLRRPVYQKPELLATAPNQVWSWDITKLLGPTKWSYFYLYVLVDIFSRFVTGWMLAICESAALARQLMLESVLKHGIQHGQLTIHADRGPAMTSKPVAFLLADLGITKTHSRPYVSDDNPYSEAQFKTIKYRPGFPDRFGSIEDARSCCGPLFDWYNHDHRHTGLNLFTPASVHFGSHHQLRRTRQAAMDAAYAAYPERFVHGPPSVHGPPLQAWINPPHPKSNKSTSPEAPGRSIVDPVDPRYLPDSGSDPLVIRPATIRETAALVTQRCTVNQ
jgi:putative transposase